MLRFVIFALLAFPALAFASTSGDVELLDLTDSFTGYFGIIVFAIAYILVMAEEYTHLRKSKPVIIAAGLIWVAIAVVYVNHGMPHAAENAVRHNLLEYAELMLFLLVAMTYINSMDERGVFEALRVWLIARGFGFRALFWITGILSFLISPVADNLTTALLMCAVVMAVGSNNARFVTLGCINIVVASNAGGAFSPFGDITTLMVWQKGMVDFWTFFALFLPAVVNFAVPAAIMFVAVPNEKPEHQGAATQMRHGAIAVVVLFLATIATAVVFHNFLHLPPVIGMLTGLGYLQLYAYYLKLRCACLKKKQMVEKAFLVCEGDAADVLGDEDPEEVDRIGDIAAFDVFNKVARAEWDTLLFFYGVVLCVGGLGFMGYLGLVSDVMYNQWGATSANVAVGVLSAIVDNIPVMFAVLTMNPDMSTGQWLLVTLTAGVGGSLLSIGSAAGVALMGQARGYYTFFGHLKWAPAIALGYVASIAMHLWWNANYF
ncbi:MAG: sodium:proton antiporter NhaD [Gammaproteobacteria bacterium]